MKRLITSLTILIVAIILPAAAQTKWFDPQKSDVDLIAGRAWSSELKGDYARLPLRIKDSLRPSLWNLSRNSAGLSLRFMTNASSITVKYVVEGSHSMYHMSATSVSGVDLYATDWNGKVAWCKSGWPSLSDTLVYSFTGLEYPHSPAVGSEYQLFLPLYTSVKHLEIGVPSAATFSFVKPTAEKPIVVYGTSITQGACASRPAMAWSNILQRQMQMPVVNLGFSGQGQLDMPMFQMLAEIDAQIYIIDCLPNLIREQLKNVYPRAVAGVKYLRSKSEAPILLAEHSGYMNDITSPEAFTAYDNANKELKRAYDTLLAQGFKNLHYITKAEIALSPDSQVDGVHPTDVGMQQYADAYTKACREILNQKIGVTSTTIPLKQNRDYATYNWNDLHEKTLQLNNTSNPEIVLIGNSITHFWGDSVRTNIHRGFETWQELFGQRKVANLGRGWDRIENVLYRIYHGEIDSIAPRKVFMMIGTNNLSVNTPQEIADGIVSLAKVIKAKLPKSELYVINILPRSDYMQKRATVNKMVNTMLKGSDVRTINIGDGLMTKKGLFNQELFSDGVHPNNKGYQIMAEQLKKYL